MKINSIRQRYLAHVRTIIAESLNQDYADSLINSYKALINDAVKADTKKDFTIQQHNRAITQLQAFVKTRREYLLQNPEIREQGPEITEVSYTSDNGYNQPPDENSKTQVTAIIDEGSTVAKVRLYYTGGLSSKFGVTEMKKQEDKNAYVADIPGYGAGSLVRFYVEAVADNDSESMTFSPSGAEHNTFFTK